MRFSTKKRTSRACSGHVIGMMTPTLFLCFKFVVGISIFDFGHSATPYYGTKIGQLNSHAHDVEGEVYAVDDKTIYLKGFTYDGQGPDAFFWGGMTRKPDSTGFIIPDEKGKKTPLGAYRNRNVLLRLPAGRTLRNVRWISIWCRKFNANFGDIQIPDDLLIPQPIEIGRIPTKEHGVSSGSVMIVDTQTLLVPEFTYDGLGPAAYWWVSRGAKQHPRGTRLADENGSFAPLPKYTGKTVVITLPDEKTIYDFDWFGVWCDEARVDFGSVQLPQNVVVPPSPRMLGIELEYKLNCEILRDDIGFEIRWIMDGEDIVMQLVAKLEENEYMSFGLSKNDSRSEMIKADAVVAWIDRYNRGHAEDYYLGSKEQCIGQRGSCPDTRLTSGGNSVTLLNAAVVNGFTMITLKRPQVGIDEKYDQHVYSDGPQAVVWAVGPINNRNEVSYHGIMRSEGDVFIDFARPPQWNCPQPADPTPATTTTHVPTTAATTTTTKRPTRKPGFSSTRGRKPKPATSTGAVERRRKPFAAASHTSSRVLETSKTAAWKIPPIICPADRTFRAQIGPAGGKKGYQSVTGDVGWGIAWYIDGYLIPEITVQRGKTYTFIVEGGSDPDNSAREHPLYITDDPEGGFEHKTPMEKKKAKVYGGVSRDRRGNYSPTAMGRMCEYKLPNDKDADGFDTFEEFQQNLELRCESGKPGRLVFRPDSNTPDLLYYQCYTHRYLGWKIHVVNDCEESVPHLDTDASIAYVKNITWNSVDSEKNNEFINSHANHKYPRDYSNSYYYRQNSTGSDDIFSDFHEVNPVFPQKLEETTIATFSWSDPTSKKQLQYESSKKPSFAAKQLYYRYPTEATDFSPKPAPYGTTTITPSGVPYTKTMMYVKYSDFPRNSEFPSGTGTTRQRNPETERSHLREKKVAPSYSLASTEKPSLVKANVIRFTVLPVTKSPVFHHSTVPSSRSTTRSQTPWWKPIATASDDAFNHPRHQHHRMRSETQNDASSISFENGFLPVVVKTNGTFEKSMVEIPQLYHSSHDRRTFKRNHVPVLVPKVRVRSESTVTANNRLKHIMKAQTRNFPFVETSSPRMKSVVSVRREAALIPKQQEFSGTRRKSALPTIPVVVPEKKAENVYVLHHVLSLITDEPSEKVKTVRIVDAGDQRTKTRLRRVRSAADHHENHPHNGDHGERNHADMHGGEHIHMTRNKNSTTSSSCSISAFSLLVALLCCLSLWK